MFFRREGCGVAKKKRSVARLEIVAGEARQERRTYLTNEFDPDPLVRTVFSFAQRRCHDRDELELRSHWLSPMT